MYNHRLLIRLIYVALLVVLALSAAGLLLLLESKRLVYEGPLITDAQQTDSVTPFPVSVNPAAGVIREDANVFVSPSDQLAVADTVRNKWLQRILAVLGQQGWYQNLASPVARIVVIWPGDRKEEIAKNIGDILRWDANERQEFIQLTNSLEPVIKEGKFYPGQYTTHRYATPKEIASLIQDSFTEEVLSRYTTEVSEQVPLADALTVASLLEREASDFENMREVSGVIWNRLFIDMPLQLDATLQYARGTNHSREWWPVPAPADKFIESPYNTYANKGLPPAPIANPTSDAILAALNPVQTDCYYYFHADDGSYHCSSTYEEHVNKLKATFGRGR